MSNDTAITVKGNLTDDPTFGFTTTGVAYARFTIASTPRRFDRNTGAWADGETLFLRCVVWRDLAEHVAESLQRGQRVIATGRLRATSWQTPEGEKRTGIELDVDDIGPSLRFATAKVTRITRTNPTTATNGSPAPDPTTQPAPTPTGGQQPAHMPAGVGAGADEPPF